MCAPQETKDIMSSWGDEPITTDDCAEWVEGTALLVTRVEYANWYHLSDVAIVPTVIQQ